MQIYSDNMHILIYIQDMYLSDTVSPKMTLSITKLVFCCSIKLYYIVYWELAVQNVILFQLQCEILVK